MIAAEGGKEVKGKSETSPLMNADNTDLKAGPGIA
jgi:hypothetical protein